MAGYFYTISSKTGEYTFSQFIDIPNENNVQMKIKPQHTPIPCETLLM